MSHSEPTTPSSTEPSEESGRRFEALRDPVEWIESYRPGGLHPTHLGDTLCNGRYKIIRKLGYGAFSTVWLAQDSLLPTLVVLKIVKAKAREASNEVRMYQHLTLADDQQAVKDHVVTLLDSFTHFGPNGEHQCLVFQPMGSSANSVLESEATLDETDDMNQYLSTKRIIKQLLLGLHCLHSRGIAHGDVNPGNLLFSLRQLTIEDVPQLIQQPTGDNISQPVKRKDGKPDKWAPGYLCADRPITEIVDPDAPVNVKISDLGSAFLITDPPTKAVTPVSLRAPELVFKLPFDNRIDIWSFGCLVYQFITKTPLFAVSDWTGMAENECDDDHLLQMVMALGHLPPRMQKMWERHNRYYGPNLKLIRSDVGPAEVSEYPIYHGQSLEEMFDDYRPKCLRSEEAKKVLAFLRRILEYEPEKRPSTAELLEDEWIRSID